MGNGAEDMENQLPGRGRGVQTLLKAGKVDAAGLEIVYGFEQFA